MSETQEPIKMGRRGFLRLAAGALGGAIAGAALSGLGLEAHAQPNQQAVEAFSDEELGILTEDYDRVRDFLSDYYGQDVLGVTINFQKVPPGSIKGHGPYNPYTYLQRVGERQWIIKMTTASASARREMYHQIGHAVFSDYIVAAGNTSVAFQDHLHRLGEGMAEAVAFQLQKGQINQGDFRPVDGIQSYLRNDEDRRDSSWSSRTFDNSRGMTDAAAAAVLVLQDKMAEAYPKKEKLFVFWQKIYKERLPALVDSRGFLRQDAIQEDFGMGAMLDKLEEEYPGFKKAFWQEPALYYGSPPQEFI